MSILNPVFTFWLLLVAIATSALAVRWVPAVRRHVVQEASRLPAIDGLRGILATAVFVHHAIITWFFLGDGSWVEPPSRFATMLGQGGVALFFMVTAFLFWGRVLATRGQMDWSGFLAARLWRLYPAYLIAVAGVFVTVGFTTGFRLNVAPGALLTSIRSWLLFALPYTADLNGFPETGRLVAYVTWSLAYELLFYLLLPLVSMLMFRRLRLSVILLCSALILAFILQTRLWTPIRPSIAASFLGGIAAAYAIRSEAVRRFALTPWAGAIALGSLGVAITQFSTAYTLPATLLLSIGFVIIACGNTLWGALDRKPVLWLGQASYSIYLLHGLVLYALADRLGDLLDPGHTDFWIYVGLATLCAVVLVVVASAVALLVEIPAIGAGRRHWKRVRDRHPLPRD